MMLITVPLSFQGDGIGIFIDLFKASIVLLKARLIYHNEVHLDYPQKAILSEIKNINSLDMGTFKIALRSSS